MSPRGARCCNISTRAAMRSGRFAQSYRWPTGQARPMCSARSVSSERKCSRQVGAVPKRLPAVLDRWLPFAGPCAFCSHPDRRHHLVDAIRGAYRAGESVTRVAAWFEVEAELVCEVVRWPIP